MGKVPLKCFAAMAHNDPGRPPAATRGRRLSDLVFLSVTATVAESVRAKYEIIVAFVQPKRSSMAAGIIWQWAGIDPQPRATGLSDGEGKMRQQAFESLVNRWTESDPSAAGSWLGTLPPGTSRDAAVSAYARRIVSSEPQTAAVWAESIENPNVREAQLSSIVSAWLHTDPTSAAAWLNHSSLSAEARARLLSQGR